MLKAVGITAAYAIVAALAVANAQWFVAGVFFGLYLLWLWAFLDGLHDDDDGI